MGKDPPEFAQMMMPASVRYKQPTLQSHTIENFVVTIPVRMRLSGSFDECISYAKPYFDHLKKSGIHIGLLVFVWISSLLPEEAMKKFIEHKSKAFTGYFTNILCSKTQAIYGGRRLIGHFCFAPIFSNAATSITLCSSGDVMGLGVMSDLSRLPQPEKLISIIEAIHQRNVEGLSKAE